MTFSVLKVFSPNAAIRNSELSYKLRNRKSELWNIHHFRTYSLFFVVRELKPICANLQFANQHGSCSWMAVVRLSCVFNLL